MRKPPYVNTFLFPTFIKNDVSPDDPWCPWPGADIYEEFMTTMDKLKIIRWFV